MDIFAVFCPDGTLQSKDMKICQKEKWIPVAVLTENNKINVLLFLDQQIAIKFIKRNYPKNWLRGVIALSETELRWMEKNNWNSKILLYPQILKDKSGFGFEIIEFESTPDLFMQGMKYDAA